MLMLKCGFVLLMFNTVCPAVDTGKAQSFKPHQQRYQPVGVVDPKMPRRHRRQIEVGQLRQRLVFNEEQKKDILDLHNHYRSIVSPVASNMRFMTWDAGLEETAQQWADRCVFAHGMPPGAEDNVGQNLYMGSIGDGLRATTLWYNETYDFKFDTNSCEGQDTQCGHYTQVVWDESHLLGCATASCFNVAAATPWHLIVCHYKPAGNHPRQPYLVGSPCSGCSTVDGGLCTNKLCITKDECSGTNSDCECPLKCHNCGIRSSENCRCQCKRGWDSLDCSRPCKDSHSLCGANPGFPNNKSCRIPNVQNEQCRLMCGQCRALPLDYQPGGKNLEETGEPEGNDDVCCAGKLCPDDYVLDPDVCHCASLCPGPKCGALPLDYQPGVKNPEETGEPEGNDDVWCAGKTCPDGYLLDIHVCNCVSLCLGTECGVEFAGGTTSLHSSIKILAAGMLIWTMTL